MGFVSVRLYFCGFVCLGFVFYFVQMRFVQMRLYKRGFGKCGLCKCVSENGICANGISENGGAPSMTPLCTGISVTGGDFCQPEPPKMHFLQMW